MSKPADELLHGLFTTALEGGIGYWSAASSYHWSRGDDDDLLGFYADIEDMEDGDALYRISRNTMRRGYELAISANWCDRLNWSTESPPSLLDTEGIEDWDYDAGDADMIVQLGLFGDVRYG